MFFNARMTCANLLSKPAGAKFRKPFRPARNHLVFDSANLVDLAAHDIASLQMLLGNHCVANALRCTSQNEITRFEPERGGEILDLLPDVIDKLLRIALLTEFAVDEAPHLELMRIADLVRRDDPGTDRSMSFE